jgi:hypothetical protein
MSKKDKLAALAAPPVKTEQDEELEAVRRQLVKTQRKLVESKAKISHLVEATREAAYGACIAQGRFEVTASPPALKKVGYEEVALWDTGDWQYSKITPSYNSDIADRRVREFVDQAIELTWQRRYSRDVNEVVVVFGGDMVEGLFNYATQPYEIDSTLFEQYVRVSRLCVEVVKKALATYEHVTVSAEWGNHGRIGSKRDAVVRSDNVDRMCFELARQLLESDSDRLTWPDSAEDVQRIEIGNYRALNMHGDEFGRTGFVAPGTFVQHVNRWRSGAYRVDGEPWAFKDVYTHHNHTFGELPLANGEGSVYWNGSTESDNRYAQMSLASQALPSQRVHFIDPAAGRVVAQHKIWLER